MIAANLFTHSFMSSKAKPATLGASLIVKGGARPSDATAEASGVVPMPGEQPAERVVVSPPMPTLATEPTASADPIDPVPTKRNEAPPSVDILTPDELSGATKAMTVKVSGATYNKLKTHGFQHGKTSQAIFQEALALYFKKYGIK